MDMHIPQDAHAEIREEVRKLCTRFPGEYWRELDARRGYPTEFVTALTEAGWLGALIPEEFGGAGLPLSAAAAILEEIHASGLQRARPATRRCTSWAPSCGTAAPAQKAKYLPAHRHRRTAPAGLRRDGTDHGHRHHRAAHLRESGKATSTSSTARRSGPAAPSIPT